MLSLSDSLSLSDATTDTLLMFVFSHLVPISAEDRLMEMRRLEDESRVEDEDLARKSRGIFDELVIYINGSTYPLVSDHKLKQLLAENGARMSMHLGRRQVTHVILGKPSQGVGSGAGGGLAGGKLEKEIRRIGGCGVKYVGVEWYALRYSLLAYSY